ncbi:MAG: peptide chain release factor 2 [Sandaracinaceae bacterium]|nr:peptide chain release factor 2 [Sandaracinaceae bacterium]
MRWGGTFDVDNLRRQFSELTERSSAEGFWDDPERAQALLRERSAVEDTISKLDKLTSSAKDLADLLDMAVSENDEGMVSEVTAQIPEIEKGVRSMEVARMLSGPEDRSDCIITIHPGAGGVDSQDWAEMLMRMYMRWCERRGFKTELIDHQPGQDAGIKEVSFTVSGPYAYGFLRAENGVHRLIRISPFDANARRQTAFAAVFVVPDLDEEKTDIVIKPEDLEVDTFRSGGKGGQHVNKTESAIRITHIPTGIIVKCQAERSQHKNRSSAMKMLLGRLYEKRRQERESSFDQTYASDKMEIGFGSQIRTYTMAPYRLVKDERTEIKVSNIDAVLDGDLDEFIEAYLLMAAARTQKTDKSASSSAAS